ncbi:MAG: protein-(glutamine-N5) methyltransferase, release factor-specific [Flavobacteriaceae bacterium]|nr:protein-(glutamine-N5) methyltransferase, release factor-specific [Flavobacteriaceae bacterium]|tara:strand:- start:36120 stop:36971 length:852 start_codon:yes stop_codon:yes gene_type:complete
MTFLETHQLFQTRLKEIYPQTEIETFFFWVLEDCFDFKRIDYLMRKEETIPIEKQQEIQKILDRLENQEPIQHILGYAEFFGLTFEVSNNTLIPRPETEELVAWVLDDLKTISRKDFSIIDIGTGSGCIPVSLAKELQISVDAVDISEEALQIAKKNAQRNKVQVAFHQMNILTSVQLPKQYDIIISNPPYVRQLEKAEMKKNVLDFEPALALFVSDEDPLIFYKAIADLAKKYLKPKGRLFFEINQYLGEQTIALLKQKGYSAIELRKDLFGNDRMIRASLD